MYDRVYVYGFVFFLEGVGYIVSVQLCTFDVCMLLNNDINPTTRKNYFLKPIYRANNCLGSVCRSTVNPRTSSKTHLTTLRDRQTA